MPDSSLGRVNTVTRINSTDVKGKIEEQLRLQREANNKKRYEEIKQGER